MSLHHLDALFRPTSVAVIGASDRPGSLGALVMNNLLGEGFAGPVWPVNLRREQVAGLPASATVEALPQAPDLAVICTPPATVPGLIAELGRRGTRAAIVLTAGLRTLAAPGGATLEQAMLDAARPHRLRILGPNCLGLLVPGLRLNASFAHVAARPGRLAFVSQSGALATAMLDWADSRGIGFSHFISLGDSADVDFGDVLDWLAADTGTRAILLYIESVKQARKFMSAARAAARKPVIVVKAGRAPAGAKAAASHTGALAGSDLVFDAAVRRAGMLRVDTLEDLFDAAETLARARPLHGERLMLLTNGGGAGVLAVDALERTGARLAGLDPATQETLRGLTPAHGAVGNPVDILGDAGPDLYGRSLGALLAAPEVDAVLVINCPTAVADSGEAADAVIAARTAARGRKPVLAAWLGEPSVALGRAHLTAAGVPTYPTAEAAVRAFATWDRAQALHALLLEAPDGADEPPDVAGARKVVEGALAEGRAALDPLEVQAVLQAYGIATAAARLARTPAEAGEAAAAVGPDDPVALKIQSPDISHKSDVGGVVLGLRGAPAVEQAARAMLDRLAAARPDARLEGFLVQPMISRPKAQEVLAGLVRDPTFGPVVVVGHGGVSVEVVADRALGLPPLNAALARDMIGQTRVSRLLAGYRDRPAADLDALAAVLVALGRLSTDLPEIAELDLNPVLCDAQGALALDARIAVRRPDAATARPAILPYPEHLARDIVADGEPLRLRPIRPSDVSRLIEMVDRCTPEDIHLRFCSGMGHLNEELATRLCQIDYDRHMAFVAETAAGDLLGVGRLVEDPEGETAEFALMVRSDRQHHGLGGILLQTVLDYAAARGLREVWGDIARENSRMLDLARALGFSTAPSEGDFARVCATKAIPAGQADAVPA